MTNNQLPETGFLRISSIVGNPKAKPPKPALIPVSRSTFYQWVGEGKFPKPTQWGARCSVWRVEDVRAWIAANGGQGGAE